jgi:hypothetical protein
MRKIPTRFKPVQPVNLGQANYSSAQTAGLFALMNSAPAELLQLLTIAALQPSSSVTPDTSTGSLFRTAARLNREKKKPPCLNRIRQCGLFFSLSFRAYSVNQRPISIGFTTTFAC